MKGSPFCEHHKLRLSCPECKAARTPPVDPGLAATPFVPRDEEPKTPRAPPKLGGRAKPLMPTRARKKVATAEEAERAQAWWVKKDK